MSEVNWVDMYTQPYAGENELLNDWVEQCLAHAKWELFENQEDWVLMAGETGVGMPPKFKENARIAIRQACMNQFHYLADYMVDRIVTEYRLSNIDLDEDTIWQLQEDLPEDGYEEWEEECRKRIFAEYKQYLGYDKAIEYFKNIWTEGWFPQ